MKLTITITDSIDNQLLDRYEIDIPEHLALSDDLKEHIQEFESDNPDRAWENFNSVWDNRR